MQGIICQHCGTIDEYHTEMKSNQQTAWCDNCGRFIKNIPYSKKFCLYFGKYKEVSLDEFTEPEHISYLNWVFKTKDIWDRLKPPIQEKIKSILKIKII